MVRALAVVVAVPLGLAGGFLSGFVWGMPFSLVGSVALGGSLPLLLCPLGGWVAGYGTYKLIGPTPRRYA
jgi:hypothetical protein